MESVLEFMISSPTSSSHLFFAVMRMAGKDIQDIKDNFKNKTLLKTFLF